MKTYIVLVLLALCTYGESSDVVVSNHESFYLQPSRVLMTESTSLKDQASNEDTEEQKYYPHLIIDFNYKRSGSCFRVHRFTSITDCIAICRRNSARCLAINYLNHSWQCQELATLGEISSDYHYSTVLVNYADGDDTCNESYFITEHVRHGFGYQAIYGEKASTVKKCCEMCRDEPNSKCTVWNYDTKNKICYLQHVSPTLSAYPERTAGYGVRISSEIFKKKCDVAAPVCRS